MKKILTLLVSMFTALCAYAEDLTFSVAVEGNNVTVTPSIDDQLYLCAPLDVEVVAFFAESVGLEINIDTPERLFMIAAGMYVNNLFTGPTTLTCGNGNYYLVMVGAEKDEEGNILTTTPIVVEALTISDGTSDDEPELEPLTFNFECDTYSFTITPSDTIQEYVVVPFPPESLDQLPDSFNLDKVETFMQYMAACGGCFGKTDTGVGHHTLLEYMDEGETMGPGIYTVAVMGVKANGDHHIITTPIYQFEWYIDHTTGIRDIKAAAVASKILKDGKFIINGRVGLDGTLVK